MFPLLGVAPALGRTFLPDDFQNGKDQVVVLSYRLWERRFARDPAILGQKLLLDGAPYTVIGVMPPRFHFSPFWITRAEMWAPQNLASGHRPRWTRFAAGWPKPIRIPTPGSRFRFNLFAKK